MQATLPLGTGDPLSSLLYLTLLRQASLDTQAPEGCLPSSDPAEPAWRGGLPYVPHPSPLQGTHKPGQAVTEWGQIRF